MQNEATWTAILRSCGHTEWTRYLSADIQRAATEIAQAATSPCGACARAARFSLAHLTWADAR